MKKFIFYSWQSDLLNATNRSFIEDALTKAARSIAMDESIEVEPVVDRDVQGMPGSPDISKTIFEKIDRSAVFIADVSIINATESGRKAPNPNVLVELGYALKTLTPNRVLMVMNTEYGGPELLPFDLRMRLAVTYNTSDKENRANEKKGLQKKIEGQLRSILANYPKADEISKPSPVETIKSLITDPTAYIKLEDFLKERVKEFMSSTSEETFPAHTSQPTSESFRDRIAQYDLLTDNFSSDVILLSKWANGKHVDMLLRIFRQMAESRKSQTGYADWIYLSHYPLLRLLYYSGIAAIAEERYDILNALLNLKVQDATGSSQKEVSLLIFLYTKVGRLDTQFRNLPDFEERHVPISEYLFVGVKAKLDEFLFLGGNYESYFDKFEIYMSLCYLQKDGLRFPIGRYGWKLRTYWGDDPLHQLIREAESNGTNWKPLKQGMFDQSHENFLKLAATFKLRLQEMVITWS